MRSRKPTSSHCSRARENNVTRAAAIAEVSRQMIQKLMRKHGLG